ncbi:hypothetical protein L1987_44603 [Smallanthus sonchifolius]|uniref:Uncharacterized protein n=1 Tax=Smallanthus sonchifolius TaxID=185202 RepID=A0ACB9GPB0_9ASTR|nr:hypothetical protein L1987_44603 [Smallanthus sonchifolius]
MIYFSFKLEPFNELWFLVTSGMLNNHLFTPFAIEIDVILTYQLEATSSVAGVNRPICNEEREDEVLLVYGVRFKGFCKG